MSNNFLLDTRTSDHYFRSCLEKHELHLAPLAVETLWVNVTSLCNQQCYHCHVNASPNRTEQMNRCCIDRCLELLSEYDYIRNLDITGGAPELNQEFDYFVLAAKKLGKNIKVRHNLTVTFDGNPQTGESKSYLPQFFADNEVEIIASLPHFGEKITDKQRGNGVFRKSIEGIRILNNLGYGKPQTSLILNLVCNIDGPITPADHHLMEKQFKLELGSIYGLTFNHLFCVTNMPINRYKDMLCATENHAAYIRMLAEVFDPQAAENVVCRSLISVGYDGSVYDCDFNQMLGRKIYRNEPMNIFNLDPEALLKRQIDFGAHCFGCTAGGGSS